MKFVLLPPHSDPNHEWLPRLRAEVPEVAITAPETHADALRELAGADAAFGTMTPELVAAAPNLRWLQAPAAAPPAGFYCAELIAHPAVVTNFREIYNDHLSHHILALMLAFAKQLHRYRDRQRRREWEPLPGPDGEQIFLPDATALIVGLGGIGTETARLCKELGMRTVAVDARRTEPPPWVDELHPPDKLDAVLGNGDFVILTIPHTPDTEGLFDAARFHRMKRSAIFINVGRGMTTRLDDLNAALRAGRIGGAGLDVFELEPLPADHPLWDAPNTIITPHVAAASGAHLDERRYAIVRDNLQRFAAGRPLRNLVDKALWF